MPLPVRALVLTLTLLLKALPAGAEGELKGHGGPVRAVAVLTDGQRLVTGGFDSAMIVWTAADGAARRVLRFHDSTINAIVSMPGGCFASAGEDARIAIWCGDRDAPVRVLTGHTAPVVALAVAADGSALASGSFDRSVRLWPLQSAEPATVLATHDGPVNGVAFLADGRGVVSAGYDGQIRIVGRAPGLAPVGNQSATPINAVAVTRDGEIVTAGADGAVRFWTSALEPAGGLQLAAGPLTAVAITPDGETVAVAGMRTPVTVVDRRSRLARFEILGPGLPVWSLAFAADGRILYSGGADRAVRRWETQTGKPAGDVAPATDPVPEAASDPGARVFRACRACHGLTAADTHLAGPTLHGVFGRRIATAPGYTYSEPLKRMDIVWSAETISKLFEVGPAIYTPGTKMPEQRITDPEDRKALVDWLAKVTK